MHKTNIFEKYRMPAILDDGGYEKKESDIIINKMKECVIITTAFYKGVYTFGLYCNGEKMTTPVEICPTSESGVFRERLHAKLYALGCLVNLFPKMSEEAANAVRRKIAELRYPKIIFL